MTRRSATVVEVDDDLQISHVRLPSPAPFGFPGEPGGLDQLSYLRYRPATGPEDPAAADAILVMQSGMWAGAASLDRVARNVVRRAAAVGLSIEWWSVSRRSEGATDLTGLCAAHRLGDPSVAVDYYYGGVSVDGRTFEGFRRGRQLRYLAELGLASVIRDQHELLVRELPDPDVRRRKVFCGGHSLGGFLAAIFAAWDFDGVPGHEQCQGLIALDTLIDPDPLGVLGKRWATPLAGLAGGLHLALLAGHRLARSAGWPRVTLAQVFTLLPLVGLAAGHDGPNDTGLHRELAADATNRTLLRALIARRYRNLTQGVPEELRLSGEALLGLAAGRTVMPFAALHMSMGALDGPRVARPSFPVSRLVRALPVVRTLASMFLGTITEVPAEPDARYGWRAGGVVDIRDVARALTSAPVPYIEAYFPMRIQLDLAAALLGARTAELRPLRHTSAVAAKPMLHVLGGTDQMVSTAVRLLRLAPANRVHAEGYTHMDMVAASDRPGEPVSTAITEFLTRRIASVRTAAAASESAVGTGESA